MSKQSKQPTKHSARLLQCTNKPELESLVYDKLQEHQLFSLPQPLVSIELSEPPQVQKNITPSIQENNVNTNCLLSELVERHPNIHIPERLSQMPLEDFDHIKEVDDLESENRSLDEEMGELEIKLKIANQRKGKSRADKLLELPASNKKTKYEKIVSDDDDSDSKGARFSYSFIFRKNSVIKKCQITFCPKSWVYITSKSEDEKVFETSSKRRQVTDYVRSIMYSRNSKLETSKSSTIGIIQDALGNDSDNNNNINEEDSNYSQ
ncbi:27906_t:CDS:2 [Gigaspora margarita]|uniref:27906_t:CDS:1 n=1 Tax=Gigaspora margarita TaxID=4874 RepID=A0ABN7UTI8_GIGMA|nr:27906_t:CDS:2 [Gigaspora margarita]